METVLERLPSGSRAAVIRLRSLGDCILTTPALRLLKQHRPDVEIGVVVEDRFAAIFEGNPDVTRVLGPRVGDVAAWRPALALNLHGGTRSIVLTVASGARFRAGFSHLRGQSTYNVRIPRAQDILNVDRVVHTAEHLASAMFYLGVPVAEVPPASLYAEPARRPRPYAVIHPFASAPDKTWPSHGFIAVAHHLREHEGMDVVFIGGPADDVTAFDQFEIARNRPLGEVKSIIAGSSFFAGNDSGPAHMAAAFGVPSIVLFGASDPVVWAPWKTVAEVLVGQASRNQRRPAELPAARGCTESSQVATNLGCCSAAFDCSAIRVDDVLAAIERLKVRA